MTFQGKKWGRSLLQHSLAAREYSLSLAGFIVSGSSSISFIPDQCEPKTIHGVPDLSNSISGSIPTEIQQLTILEYLSLYSNNMNGTLPGTEFGTLMMDQMSILSLYNNKFTGTIPVELFMAPGMLSSSNQSSIQHMEQFKLHQNQLTGTIPTEIGLLKNSPSLISVTLDRNQFNGTATIPTQLGELSTLEYLSMYSSNLVGTIPSELGQLTQVTTLELQDNVFDGSIPEEVCRLQIFGKLSNFQVTCDDNNDDVNTTLQCDCSSYF